MHSKYKTLSRLLFALPVIIALSGCGGGSKITHSYVDPELDKLDLHGVLVIAVTRQPSPRKMFEDAYTSALQHHGVNAIASHTVLSMPKPTSEQVIAAAKKAGVDTIMVSRYIGEQTEEVYHPGTIYYGVTPALGMNYYGGFGGYYAHAYEVAYQQPVWTSNTTHAIVSDLYVAETHEHIWQAVSETLQSGSSKQVREDTIKTLVGDLKSKGLIR
tara:strand:+ start:97563 stop:98207 length:645 start_codon:yes stop_codon:yes gene_type:complete